ncbi:MAG: hypothetical protein LBV46_01475 [Bacteroidales bacterium]|jgi:hypothetical protein|nr:hypothetical protein [Bacteroidales bacterium]
MNNFKFLTVIVFFSCSLSAFPQDAEDKIKPEIAALFDKADKNNLQNVLPYQIGGQTGLIDAKTKKVILKPTDKLRISNLFHPDMEGSYETTEGYQQFIINGTNFAVENYDPEIDIISQHSEIKKIPSSDGYNGFSVNKWGLMESLSDLYEVESDWSHHPVVKYHDAYYAIVKKDGYYGVIDMLGNPLPHFNFAHKKITKVDTLRDDDDVWFITDGVDGLKGSFVSFKGEVKLKDELLSVPKSHNFGQLFEITYCASSDSELMGVLDVRNLEWIIKPQSNYKFTEITYTSKKKVNTSTARERDKVTIYLWVKDGEKKYLVDLDMQKYIP